MHYGKNLVSVFQEYFAIQKIFDFGKKNWVQGSHSINVRHFPDIYEFPKVVSLKSFGNLSGNSYIVCLSITIAHRFTWGDRKVW